MLLAIDTATAACSVALIDGDRLVDGRYEEVGRGHAERLLPMIAELLGTRRPAAILVDCGPGSFTGIRVGIAAARALGLGWGVPVTGYAAPVLLAARAARDTGAVALAVAITGGHGELFVQRFAGQPPRAASALASLPPAEARRFAPDSLVVGSGAEALLGLEPPAPPIRFPDARDAVLLAAGDRLLPPTPIYGRAPDAALPAAAGPA